MTKIKEWIKSFLGITALKQSRELREEAKKDLIKTKVLLTLDGEEKWMMKLCIDERDKKECYPNDDK